MTPETSEDKLLTPPQVAQRLQVHERTVTQWLRRGNLRGFKIGKEWRVSAHDFEAFLEQGANIPVGVERKAPRSEADSA